jgi:hypothetical protein
MSKFINIEQENGELIMLNMETAHEERLKRVFARVMTPELALKLVEAGVLFERAAQDVQ